MTEAAGALRCGVQSVVRLPCARARPAAGAAAGMLAWDTEPSARRVPPAQTRHAPLEERASGVGQVAARDHATGVVVFVCDDDVPEGERDEHGVHARGGRVQPHRHRRRVHERGQADVGHHRLRRQGEAGRGGGTWFMRQVERPSLPPAWAAADRAPPPLRPAPGYQRARAEPRMPRGRCRPHAAPAGRS